MRLLGMTLYLTVFNLIESNLRIFWAQNANSKEYLYIASLRLLNNETKDEEFVCTCTIIKPTWTLTAGHCVTEEIYEPEKRIIAYDPGFLSGNDSYSFVIAVHIHPSFLNSKINDDDIALLRTTPIVLERYGRLSSVDYTTLVGHAARVFGFGLMNYGDVVGTANEQGTKLQAADVVIKKCPEVYEGCLVLSPKCGDLSIICPGDSGGPVIHPSGVVAVTISMPLHICTEEHYIHKKITVDFTGGVIPVSRYINWISFIIKSR